MAEQNPFDALDEAPSAISVPPAAVAPTNSSANPFDSLDEAPADTHTAATMQEVTDQAHMPEVTVSARGGREASWSDVAAEIPTAIGAGIETKMAGAQEFLGQTAYSDARKKFWQATVLPDAVRDAKKQGLALTDMPEVQSAAEHLGIRPDTFTRDWPTYVNQSPEDLEHLKAEQRDRIQTASMQMAAGTKRRLTAQQVQERYAPNMDQHSLKAVVFDAATMAPDILAGVGGTVATGGVGGAAIMAADIAPSEYAAARNRGLDHNHASTYAVLSTLASSVPEVPVLKIVENTPYAKKVIGGIVGEKLASTGVGKVAGTAAAQGVTQSVVNALQQGIDAGVLNEHLPLDEALKQVAWSGLVGSVVGAPLGAFHAATSRQPKPTTFRDIPYVGEAPPETAPGGPGAAEEPMAPSVAPPSLGGNREGIDTSAGEFGHVGAPSTSKDTSGEGNGEPQAKNISPPAAADEHAALLAVKNKSVTPPQVELLEQQGLIKRNDLNEPVLLPAGRRRLAELKAAGEGDNAPEITPPPPSREVLGTIAPKESQPEAAGSTAQVPEPEVKALGSTEAAAKESRNEPEAAGINRLANDPGLRQGLAAMKDETGWAQVGGRVIRDASTDQVSGRTSWIPNADWWPGRPKGLKEQEVHAAIDKALAGQPLKKRERAMVDYMAQVHDERMAMAATHQELKEAVPELPKQPEGALDLTLLASRAAEFDANEAARIMDTWEDDKPETIARIRGQFEQIIGRGHGNKESLELTAQEGRTGQSAPAQRAPRAVDLFGEDRSSEQALADEQRRRDAQRSPNRDVSLETGLPGDLFSQSRRQVDFTDQLKTARKDTETAPSEGQKAAGNYAKGEISFAGMKVSIENPKGSTRRGVDAKGKPWASTLAHDYGYINRTEGHDGDHVDAFLTGKPDTGKVFVVNQIHPDTGKFDEHKAILGASSEAEARATYEANYPRGWKGEESIAEFSTPAFRSWVHSEEPSRGAIRPPSRLERRTESGRRAKVAEMTPEQLRKELLTHELTGIPNRRAYNEAQKLPHQISIDVDSLKWVNDHMGHESGNELLKAIASSLSSHSDNVFHLSGDEFAAQAHTETEAHELLNNVAEHLKGASIEVEMPDGRVVKLKGMGVSYGVGKTLEEADAALSSHKARRQAEGARAARGEAPPGASVGAREEGRENKAGNSSEGVRPRPTKLFRGTEEGIEGRTRFSPDGEIGEALYATPSRKIAASYGGGSRARTGAGRTIHELTLPELPSEQYGYIEGGSREDELAQLVNAKGEVLHEYEPTKKVGRESRAQIRRIAEAHGIKVVVGMPDSIARNQVAILDAGILHYPKYRRTGEAEGGGLPRAQVERIVHNTVREAGISGFPHVEVHEDTSTLPESARHLIEAAGAESTTGAVYDPVTGRIHLVAGNNGSETEVRENLWHEAVGHHGLRLAMDGPQYNAIMDGIARDMPERVEAAAQRNGLDLGQQDQRRAAAEEVIAYAAGQHLSGQAIAKPVLPYWKRAVRAVKAFFARMSGKPFYDDNAIAGLIQQARQALEHGGAGTLPGEPSRSTRAPIYYSPVERAVTASKQAKASADQWLATIQKMPGVKREELEWLNLEPWLKEHKGQITREELADYVRANKLEIHETLQGEKEGEEDTRSEDQIEQTRLAEELRAEGLEVSFDAHGRFEYIGVPAPGAEGERQPGFEPFFLTEPDEFDRLPERFRARAQQLNELSIRIAEEREAREFEEDYPTEERATQYRDYTLPGGTNYRELLLRLPPLEVPADAGPPGWAQTGNSRSRTGDPNYQSSHWGEPNIVAHARFNERTDADGKKVLFIEEVQSDWHQAGRNHGYQSELDSEQQAKLKAIDDKISRLRREGTTDQERQEYFRPGRLLARGSFGSTDEVVAYHPGPEGHAYRWSVDVIERNSDGSPKPGMRARNHATDPADEIIKDLTFQRRQIDNGSRVPDAPLRTSWPMLVMKRMVRWAAENGFDRIAWTTGEQQAERFGIERHVAELMHQEGGPRGRRLIAYDKDGGIALDEQVRDDDHLAQLVGEELAQRLMATNPTANTTLESDAVRQGLTRHPVMERSLTGVDLKMGGEGMRGFYDDILPRETNKLIKKYGAKVDDTRVVTADRRQFDEARESGNQAMLQAAQAPAHGFDITDAMRQAALGEGFPMFARRQQDLPLEENRERGPYAMIRRAVNAVHESAGVRDVRKLANPAGMSPEARQVAQIAREALGELAHETVKTQEALEHFSRLIDKIPMEDQLRMMDEIERGAPQSNPDFQPVADEMRKTLDTWRGKVQGLGDGYLDSFIENYFPHYWRRPGDAQRMVASIMGRRPLRGPASFLKMRTIPSIKEGMDAGLTPLTTNPLIMTLLKTREMQRFVTGVTLMRRYKEDGLAQFLPAGRPMPDGWAPINDNIAKVRQWSEAENGFIERGQYIMPVDAARVINNHVSASALRDFAPAQIIRRGANALNAMQLGFSAFHLGFTTLDAMISKNAQGIERLLHGEVGQAVRSFSEGLTPVGAYTNVRRGYKLLQAYSDPAGATPEMQKLVRMLEMAGGRAHMDRYYQAAEGVSPFRGVGPRSLANDIRKALTAPQDKLEHLGRALGSFPVEYANKLWRGMREIWATTPVMEVPVEMAMRVVRASTSWIMEHLVPMQKLGVFSDLAADHLRRHPLEDPNARAAAMQRIWDSVDNRLGEMVYDNLFWNRTMKDSLHLGIRAVGWNVGTVREIAGAPGDIVKAVDKAIRTGRISAEDLGHRIPYVLAMASTTALYAATYQYLATGQSPQELKDYFFPRTGGTTNYGTPERVSLPSYVKDVYEYSQRPGQTVVNKLNPIFSVLGNLYSNEDFFGNPITDPEASYWRQKLQQLQFVGKEATPFSLQGRQQMQATEQPSGFGTAVKKALPMIGITPAPGYITSGEQMERRKRLEDDQKYTRELKYQMKRALTSGDKARAAEITKEYVESIKRMAETRKLVEQDKAKAATSRRKAAISMRQAGYPATADLVASLPLEPDRQARDYFAHTVSESTA